MNKRLIIKQTEEYVKKTLGDETSGHDYWHVYRVWKMAKHIAKVEKADTFVVELTALLHDIADSKMHEGDEEIGARTARHWLTRLEVEKTIIEHICHTIRYMSFHLSVTGEKPKLSKEGQIVQDADRLDALGAIGIARAFAYGGHKGRILYDPDVKPHTYTTVDEYKKSTTHTINHFYEKLLLLKDSMNTTTAKKIATQRTKYMKQYLERFFSEWNSTE